jgi:hypothetical protein
LRTEAGATSVKDTVIRDNSQDGVAVVSGAVTAHFDRVRMQNNGINGILFDLSAASVRASIGNSVITDNSYTGVHVESASGALVTVDIQSSEVASNGWGSLGFGIFVNSSDANAKSELSVANSVIARNRNTGVYANANGVVHVSVTDSTLTGNYAQAIVGAGANATVIASRNTVTRNATTGLQNSGGAFYSTGDNRVQGNFGSPTSGTISTLGGL